MRSPHAAHLHSFDGLLRLSLTMVGLTRFGGQGGLLTLLTDTANRLDAAAQQIARNGPPVP
jgi:hypothetical protein